MVMDDKSLEGAAVLGALSTYNGSADTARFSDLHFTTPKAEGSCGKS